MGDTGWTRTRAVLSLGMVLGLGAVGTMAAWSDSATATTGMFSTSSIQMKVDGQRSNTNFTKLSASSMLRGQTKAGQITVENTGTVDFTWAVTPAGTGSPELLGALQVSVHVPSANDSGSSCGGASLGSAPSFTGNTAIVSGQTLVAGASEPVCVQVRVDPNAGKNVRFKIADLGFDFTAEGVTP